MASSPPPNVVLILAEDLGYGDPSCYGHPYSITPNIDSLAEDGTRFLNFHVSGTTCAPSRAGFMTGRHPATWADYPPDFGFQGAPTVTELLRDGAGYRTGHVGKWHIGPDDGIRDGAYGIDVVRKVGTSGGHEEGKDFDVFEAAIDFLDSVRDRRPFYLNVWGHIAHSPVNPHRYLVERFGHVVVDRDDFGRNMGPIFRKALGFGGDLDDNMRHYLGDVYAMDLQVGKLLRKIDDLGLRDDTLVVFTADQGAAPPLSGQDYPQRMLGYAGGFRGGKHDFYEGGVRTSFVARWPGRIPARRVNGRSLISGLDWLPTLCSLAGVPINGTMFEGEDMSDVLKGESDRSRAGPLFWRTSGDTSPKAMLYGRWKYHITRAGDRELFDLESNPEEDVNVRSDRPDIAGAMAERLDMWLDTLPDRYCVAKRGCSTAEFSFDPDDPPVVVGPPPLLVDEEPEGESRVTPVPTTQLPSPAPPTCVPTESPDLPPSPPPSPGPIIATIAPRTGVPSPPPSAHGSDGPTGAPTPETTVATPALRTGVPSPTPSASQSDCPTKGAPTAPPTPAPTLATPAPRAGVLLSPSPAARPPMDVLAGRPTDGEEGGGTVPPAPPPSSESTPPIPRSGASPPPGGCYAWTFVLLATVAGARLASHWLLAV